LRLLGSEITPPCGPVTAKSVPTGATSQHEEIRRPPRAGPQDWLAAGHLQPQRARLLSISSCATRSAVSTSRRGG